MGSSPGGKEWGILVDRRLHRSQQWVLAARQVSSVLGCMNRNVARRLRAVISPATHHLLSYISREHPVLVSPHRTGIDKLEQV